MAALNFPTNPSDGDVYGGYVYNAAKGVWTVVSAFAPTTIDGLTDVSVSQTVATDDALLFNSTSGLWESSALAAGDIKSGTFDIARIPTGTTSSTVAAGDHLHDDRYYTETEVNTLLSGKANSSHTHTAGDLPNLESLNGTLDIASGGTGATTLSNAQANMDIGLVNVMPSSVTVSSGTSSVSADGLVTIAGAGSASLNGIFINTAYKNYRIIIGALRASVNTQTLCLRYRSGTTDSTVGYYVGGDGRNASGTSTNFSTSNGSIGEIFYPSAIDYGATSLDVLNPNIAAETIFLANSWGGPAGIWAYRTSGLHDTASGYNGITFLMSGNATFECTIQIYGYR